MTTITAPEVWRPVPGHTLYEVSTHGRVRSWRRPTGPVILPGHRTSDGYVSVFLTGPDGKSHHQVHRLVAAAFSRLQPDQEVRHLDGARDANLWWNLAPGTTAQNAADRVRHGRTNAARTHCKRGHEFTEDTTYVVPSTGARQCRPCRAHTIAVRDALPAGTPAPRTARRAAIAAALAEGGTTTEIATRFATTRRIVQRIRRATTTT